MANCAAACLITAPSFDYGNCGLEDAIRSGYIKNFIALRCDETIPDINDDTAIQAQVTAGTVFASPTLTGEIPFPTVGDELVENCQAPQPTSRTYAFNFTTYRVDNTSLTDSTSWDNLQGSLTTWFIAPVNCDNVIFVPQDFDTSGTFFEMRGTISGVLPNENAMRYEGQLQFKYNSILKAVQLSSQVIAVLGIGGDGPSVT